MVELFCQYQMPDVLDEKQGRRYTACCAHLAEGHVHECHHKMSDVIYDSKSKSGSGMRIPRDEDFEPLEEMVEKIRSVAQKVHHPVNLLYGSVMCISIRSRKT